MNGNDVVGNDDKEEIWRLPLTCCAEGSTHIGFCYTLGSFLGRSCTSVTFFLNLEHGENVGDATSWKEHILMDLKNRAHLKICYGNCNRVVTSRQNCVWRKEIVVCELSSSSEDRAKSTKTENWGLSCPRPGNDRAWYGREWFFKYSIGTMFSNLRNVSSICISTFQHFF